MIRSLRMVILFVLITLAAGAIYRWLAIDDTFIAEKRLEAIQRHSKMLARVDSLRAALKPLRTPVLATRISINGAPASELIKLPRIGPKTAERIIAHRSQHPFRRLADLKKVRGIGDKTFKRLEKYISL